MPGKTVENGPSAWDPSTPGFWHKPDPTPDCYGHLGNGLVDRQSLFVSLCNSAFETKQINLNENWEVKKKRKKIMR